MSITLSSFMTIFNKLIDDNITGTTTSNGNAGGTTFVDSSLCKYEDGYFGDPERMPQWWAYVGTTLRQIKNFNSSSGTVEVYTAFGSQVSSSTAYSLHRFDRDKKVIAINQALDEAYPYFYKRIEDATTLDGTGSSDNKYQVPATFTEFPTQIWSIDDDTDEVEHTRIANYHVEEISGTMYFYADITEDEDILLIGKKPLTQFTTDTSTTELTNSQAAAVALLAAGIFFQSIAGVINAADSGRYDSLSNRYFTRWEDRRRAMAMPVILPEESNEAWTNG